MATYIDEDSLIFHETPNEQIHRKQPIMYRLTVWGSCIDFTEIFKKADITRSQICISVDDWESIKSYIDHRIKFSNK